MVVRINIMIQDPRQKKLYELCDTEEKAKFAVFYNARIQNLKTYKDNPTASCKKDFEAAEAGFAELIENLEAKYASQLSEKIEIKSIKIYKNANQVFIYAQKLGLQCSYNTIRKDLVKDNLVLKRKGGGWTVGKIKEYLLGKFNQRVNSDSKQDKPVKKLNSMDTDSPAAKKNNADAYFKEMAGKRQEFKLKIESGEYTKTEIIDAELAIRAQVFKHSLEAFIYEQAQKIIGILGASSESAAQIVKIANGSENSIPEIIRFAERKIPVFINLYIKELNKALDIYATAGIYLNTEMAEAVKKLLKSREIKNEQKIN